MVGQRDASLTCALDEGDTYEAGDAFFTNHEIPIFLGETAGVYPLYIGVCDAETQERLPVFDASGNPAGDMVNLAPVNVVSQIR